MSLHIFWGLCSYMADIGKPIDDSGVDTHIWVRKDIYASYSNVSAVSFRLAILLLTVIRNQQLGKSRNDPQAVSLSDWNGHSDKITNCPIGSWADESVILRIVSVVVLIRGGSIVNFWFVVRHTSLQLSGAVSTE